jgi:hypothetical protein
MFENGPQEFEASRFLEIVRRQAGVFARAKFPHYHETRTCSSRDQNGAI